MEPKILRNRARCRRCGTVLESRHTHDLQTCSCGAISIDGGLDYLRRLGEPADIEELSEGEQQKDPEFWEARNQMIVRQVAGTMALSGLPLTEEDKARILYLCEHPDEEEAMLEELIRKHTRHEKHY